jgi:hypothetical protein
MRAGERHGSVGVNQDFQQRSGKAVRAMNQRAAARVPAAARDLRPGFMQSLRDGPGLRIENGIHLPGCLCPGDGCLSGDFRDELSLVPSCSRFGAPKALLIEYSHKRSQQL